MDFRLGFGRANCAKPFMKSYNGCIPTLHPKVRRPESPASRCDDIHKQRRLNRRRSRRIVSNGPTAPAEAVANRVVKADGSNGIVMLVGNDEVGLTLAAVVLPDPGALLLDVIFDWREILAFSWVCTEREDECSVSEVYVAQNNIPSGYFGKDPPDPWWGLAHLNVAMAAVVF
jgi:hypothetical protein